MFWKNNSHWDRTLLNRDENASPLTRIEWIIHILIPNVLKFIQGILVLFVTFVAIVQSDNIIELLKDFATLMVLSETDCIFFQIVANGYLGPELQMKSIEARVIKVESESVSSDDSHGTTHSTPTNLSSTISKHFILCTSILSPQP